MIIKVRTPDVQLFTVDVAVRSTLIVLAGCCLLICLCAEKRQEKLKIKLFINTTNFVFNKIDTAKRAREAICMRSKHSLFYWEGPFDHINTWEPIGIYHVENITITIFKWWKYNIRLEFISCSCKLRSSEKNVGWKFAKNRKIVWKTK